MAVITKTFQDKSITSVSGKAVTINGVLSDSGTLSLTNAEVNLSRLWLNALYTTFSEAGYSVSKDETNYSLTVMGFKFFTYIYCSSTTSSTTANCTIRFALPSYNSILYYTSQPTVWNKTNGFYCSVRIKGVKNDCFRLTYGGSANINDENLCMQVFKSSNMIDNNIYFTVDVANALYCIKQDDKYYQNRYTLANAFPYKNTSTDFTHTEETTYRFVVKPCLLYNMYYTPSLLLGNSSLFVYGNYYKIDDIVYYHTFLYPDSSATPAVQYPIFIRVSD